MIYIHIPFCDGKCFYCNFVSGKYSEEIIENYFKALEKEIESKCTAFKQKQISSIFFGGGTPSSVDTKYICQILNLIKNKFNVKKDAEITIECNPNNISENKLKNYKQLGINRISFGVQTLSNKLLKLIGRKHTKIQAINAIKLANKIGFKALNADVLIGLPKQNYFLLKKIIKKLINLKINHISCYMLINENGTQLNKMVTNNIIKLPKDEISVTHYNKLNKLLKRHKFYRYEISNFCKSGFECSHNNGYWNMTEYIGFGVSAHSYYQSKRFANTNNLVEYINNCTMCDVESLTKEDIIKETIMLGLRQECGVSIYKLKLLGYNIVKEKQKEINFLLSNGFIEIKNNMIKVCSAHFGVCNTIILKLLP